MAANMEDQARDLLTRTQVVADKSARLAQLGGDLSDTVRILRMQRRYPLAFAFVQAKNSFDTERAKLQDIVEGAPFPKEVIGAFMAANKSLCTLMEDRELKKQLKGMGKDMREDGPASAVPRHHQANTRVVPVVEDADKDVKPAVVDTKAISTLVEAEEKHRSRKWLPSKGERRKKKERFQALVREVADKLGKGEEVGGKVAELNRLRGEIHKLEPNRWFGLGKGKKKTRFSRFVAKLDEHGIPDFGAEGEKSISQRRNNGGGRS